MVSIHKSVSVSSVFSQSSSIFKLSSSLKTQWGNIFWFSDLQLRANKPHDGTQHDFNHGSPNFRKHLGSIKTYLFIAQTLTFYSLLVTILNYATECEKCDSRPRPVPAQGGWRCWEKVSPRRDGWSFFMFIIIIIYNHLSSNWCMKSALAWLLLLC